jgi:non-homologous end joining protein Ku
MQAIWTGSLKCSLVTIPFKMFISSTRRPLQFHLFSKAYSSRIQRVTFQEETPRGHFRAPASKRLIE